MKECRCNMRTKLVGDGCEVCNPELAADIRVDNAYDDGFKAGLLKAAEICLEVADGRYETGELDRELSALECRYLIKKESP